MGTAQTKANNKYKSKAYDRIELIVKKGDKDKIRNLATSLDMSVNEFFNFLLDNYLKDNDRSL